MGTGLVGSGAGATIVNPTTSFTPSDTYAFLMRLKSPADSTKARVILLDPSSLWVFQSDIPIQANTTVISASFGPLGSILKEPNIGYAPAKPPAGSYSLTVFLYPPPFRIDYANGAEFDYTP
jgi:hypothetical protein